MAITDKKYLDNSGLIKTLEKLDEQFNWIPFKKLLDARKSTSYLFEDYEGTSVDSLIKYDDTSNVTNMEFMFAYSSSLTSIPALNTSKVTNMGSMFRNCTNIEQIHMINIGTDLDIHYCTKMERDALLEVLNNLKDLTDSTSKKLTLGSTLLAKLTDDDKLIATNKNWTLA